MRVSSGLFALLVACSGAGPAATTPAPVRTPALPAAPAPPRSVTVKREIKVSGRTAGTFETSARSDGGVTTITSKLIVVENGRGPKIDATIELAPDGTIRSFTATGQHMMGTKVDEKFSLASGKASWRSTEQAGDKALRGPAIYVPIASEPLSTSFVVGAALKNGGSIDLLPDGTAQVKRIAELEVSANGERRLLGLYEVLGLAFTPSRTWLNPDGTWFGDVADGYSFVPVGWDGVVPALYAKQKELEKAYDAKLAAELPERVPAAGVAFTHARVLDVARGVWLPDHTVVAVGETITAVGPAATVRIPAGAREVDCRGKALLPGLIDMHSHTSESGAALGIASGVTTVRDVGNEPDYLDELKARFEAGTAIGPRVVRYGFIEGRNEKAASSRITAETPEEAKAAVEFFAARKYEGIKIYNSVKVELVPLLAKLAHDKGMKVIGHIPVHMLAHEAVDAGYDGIEHINMLFLNFFATRETDTRDTTRFTLVGERAAGLDLDGKPVRDFLAKLARKKTLIDPTLVAFEDLFMGQPGKITEGLEPMVSRLPAQVQRWFITGGLPLEGDKQATYRAAWTKILAMVKALEAAKVPLVLGTDSIGGLMLHHEMELFARAGIANQRILQMATIDAARALGLDKQIGTIAKGKRAELVVVDGDPLASIGDIRAVVTTLRGGALYPATPLYAAFGVAPFKPAN